MHPRHPDKIHSGATEDGQLCQYHEPNRNCTPFDEGPTGLALKWWKKQPQYPGCVSIIQWDHNLNYLRSRP